MIKLGIIGLGEVAQLMHIPVLCDLGDKFKITAISDVSPSLVKFILEKYSIPNAFLTAEEVVSCDQVDAVLVLSPDQYHCEYAKMALENGKHVFIEKPIALCESELNSLIEAEQKAHDKVVMVGYMRRFAGPFLKAKEILEREPKDVRYIRCRDNICEGPFYVGQTRPVFCPSDVPGEIIEASGKLRAKQIEESIGTDLTQRQAFTALSGLGCHTLSAVRELVGLPKDIKSVTTLNNGTHLVITFEYEGFLCLYELVNDQSFVDFDAAIELFQGDRKLKIKYETPYIRHQPSHLEVIESTNTDTKTTTYGPYFADAFTTELVEFYNCIIEGRAPKTSLEDAKQDLLLFKKIVSKIGG